MGTNRDLLFGLVAFQKGAIDADRLGETCAAWNGEAAIPLADQLVERGWLTVEQKTELECVVAGELKAHGGDLEATLAANIDGRCLEALGKVPQMELVVKAKGALSRAPAGHVLIETLSSGESDSRERYTLSHLYAKGGMGQVWLAHDAALGREIALKELRPDQANNPEVCSRFLTEARVTAQLEHPGIVPVYELGEAEPPFYTMRFVKGGTLCQATRTYHKERTAGTDDPVGMVKLLGAFVGVCHALAYAHSKGVIHRDLKGHNIVMGDFGEVIVLDWGLAKRIEPAAGTAEAIPDSMARAESPAPGHADADETLPPEHEARNVAGSHPRLGSGDASERTMRGQLLGTPAYMAPEQAEGRQHQTDCRTDVYGLGAILYEILTGQPPFHARTTTELLKKVRHDLPKPPRQINSQVAPALQAICLKALDKVPENRYASATELAQEVQRYLADEPVSAYPEPLVRRAARWGRKHRTAIAAALGLLVAATAALSVSTVLIARERNEAQAQRNEAQIQRGEAQTQSLQARQAVNDMYTKVAENWLEDRLDPLQKEFLEKTLGYYETFTRQAAREPAVRLEHGRTYQRMGDIHRKFGRSAESEAAYNRALEILEPLLKEAPGDPEVHRALAVTRSHLGDLSARRNLNDEAALLYKQAENLLDSLDTSSSLDRLLLARTLRGKAELLRRQGDIEAARPTALRACELFEQAHAAEPRNTEFQSDLAQANDFLGRVLHELGDMSAAEKAFRRAYVLLDQLVTDFPTLPRYREAMFHACNGLGGIEHESSRWADCEVHWRRQFKEAERLFQDFPHRFEYQRFLAGGCTNLGGILAEQSRFREAEPILRRGVELNTALSARYQSDEEIRFDLGNCHYNLGYLQLKQGRAEDALTSAELARKFAQALLHTSPKIPVYRRAMAWACRLRGEALDAQDRPGVEEAYREWLSISESLATQFPANVLYQVDLARCQSNLGGLLARFKRDEEAEQMYQHALAVLEPREPSGWTLERRREKAMVLTNQGEFRRAARRPGSEASLRESISIARELASKKPAARDDRQFLAIAQNNLAEELEVQNKLEDAEKLFKESLSGLEWLATELPTAIDTQNYLGYVAEQQGKLLTKTNRPAEAKLAFEKAVTHQKQAVSLSAGRSSGYREMLAGHLRFLADVCLLLSVYDDAMHAAVDLPKYAPQQAQGYFDAARILARCVSQAQGDRNLTPARRDEIVRSYLGRTVVMLREAIDANAKLTETIKTDPSLKELLERSEFQSMLSSVVDLGKAAAH